MLLEIVKTPVCDSSRILVSFFNLCSTTPVVCTATQGAQVLLSLMLWLSLGMALTMGTTTILSRTGEIINDN